MPLSKTFGPKIEKDILIEKKRSLERGESLAKARTEFFQLGYSLANFGSLGTVAPELRLEHLYELQNKYSKAARKLRNAEKIIHKERFIQIESVENYEDLLAVALWEIEEYGFDTMASFPIFTGTEDPGINLSKGDAFIRKVSDKLKVWSQIPYLDMNLETKNEIDYNPKEKFEKFYDPILSSGLIKNIVMREGWDKALGCITEHEMAKKNNLNILYEVRDKYGHLRIQKDLEPFWHGKDFGQN